MPARRVTIRVLVMLLAAACAAPVTTSQPTDQPSAERTDTLAEATPTAEPTETPLPTPADLSGRPLIWYAPLPPMPGRTGSVDFMDQFEPEAPWSRASDYVDVYKLYGEWVGGVAGIDQLAQAVADIRRRGQILAVEVGPLDATPDCGQGVESFAGLAPGRNLANRVIVAGGRIAVLALDEPYYFAHVYDGPNACHWSVERIAEAVANYVREIRKIFPELLVGDIEANPPPVTAKGLADWLHAYQQAAGEPFAFLHLDVDWHRADWVADAHDLQTRAADANVPLGIIYNGGVAPLREQWIQIAGDRIKNFDSAGPPADHAVFQSWMVQPDHALPETDPTTFSGLVARYVEDYAALGTPTSGPGANIALRQPAHASASLPDARPAAAVDGDFDTGWNAGDGPPQWIEVDFDGVHDVAGFRLSVGQFPNGQTVHRVLGRTRAGELILLERFDGITNDGQTLAAQPATPWRDLTGIRIETRETPSWVAWREIEVFAP